MPLDRREFLTTVGTAAAALAAAKLTLGQSTPPPTAATKTNIRMTIADNRAFLINSGSVLCLRLELPKPNILMIIADDHGYHDSGAYGNSEVRTPNIDRLAKQSLRFTNYFTPAPICAPARSSLYTGLYPVKNGAHPNHSQVYDQVQSLPHYLKPFGYRVGLAGKTHIAPPKNFPFEYLPLPLNEKAIADFIAKPGPFCLIVASPRPHTPWSRGGYDPATLTLPPYLVDTPETRQALADYYHDVTEFDKHIGMCLDLLDQNHLTDNTLTLTTSDHGVQFPHGKWTCYDLGLKVELLARWPGHIKPGVTNALASHVDFVPTAIELAGGLPPASPPPNLDGKSLLPLLLGKTDKIHDAVFGVETTRGIIKGSDCYPVRSIRTLTHKYIWNLKPDATFQNVVTAPRPSDVASIGYWNSWVEKAKTDPDAKKIVDAYQHRPEEELYDVFTDPDELINLAADPKYAAIKADLRKQLEAFMKDQGDKGIETEMDAKNRQVAGPPE
ncbi:MAG: sulfatase [Phycisphaerales bacterium]|nr:sulfatase [Phycisphaerales bacterium]